MVSFSSSSDNFNDGFIMAQAVFVEYLLKQVRGTELCWDNIQMTTGIGEWMRNDHKSAGW